MDDGTRTDYVRRLVTRAEQDDAFRQLLVADPRAAVKDELGIDVPGSIRLRVIEEQPDEAILVLPAAATGPLSDEQLDGIAGAGEYSGNAKWTHGTFVINVDGGTATGSC